MGRPSKFATPPKSLSPSNIKRLSEAHRVKAAAELVISSRINPPRLSIHHAGEKYQLYSENDQKMSKTDRDAGRARVLALLRELNPDQASFDNWLTSFKAYGSRYALSPTKRILFPSFCITSQELVENIQDIEAAEKQKIQAHRKKLSKK